MAEANLAVENATMVEAGSRGFLGFRPDAARTACADRVGTSAR